MNLRLWRMTDAEKLAQVEEYCAKVEAAQFELARRTEALERSVAMTEGVIRQIHLALLANDQELALRLVLDELRRIEG